MNNTHVLYVIALVAASMFCVYVYDQCASISQGITNYFEQPQQTEVQSAE